MGVHGLWDLLSPVGRRVSVETLAGKKLAIDASIWMVQFMKAMRDEKGEMVRNAHLLGFFRRICKLLFLRTKPVFVFDGGTPALKRRTVVARRRQRENAQAKIRKTAEKLLLNQLKAMKLKELADNIKNQRQKNDLKGKKVLSDQSDASRDNPAGNEEILTSFNQEELDEMLAASIAAEEGSNLTNYASTSGVDFPLGEGDNEDEELILPEPSGIIDPSVLAALPESMQRDLLIDQINTKKPCQFAKDAKNQEKLDRMLAESIMAEQGEKFSNIPSTSSMPCLPEEDGDGDEEMILPEMHGKIDPAVLAALPPSLQLDLFVQMRERLMAENRQKYQKVKKDPSKFSELQIQSYLKTVAFRREIDGVQKSAAGTGVGGVQTSRIASEANREYIFSSSFTGDKRLLTSRGTERTRRENASSEILSSDPVNDIASTGVKEPIHDESTGTFDDDVGTYLDERGRVRVSRVRGMGIHMSRDLQRNLDLIKEIEQERTIADNSLSPIRNSMGVSDKNQHVEISESVEGYTVGLNKRNAEPNFENETCIEVTFNNDGEKQHLDGEDDDIFARLVEGNSVTISSAHSSPKRQLSDSASDCDWEEGVIQGEGGSSFEDIEVEDKPSSLVSNCSDENLVQWVEGTPVAIKKTVSFSSEVKAVSKGYLEEEADLQEALRRSLMDTRKNDSGHQLSGTKQSQCFGDEAHEYNAFCDKKVALLESSSVGKNSAQQHEITGDSVVETLEDAVGNLTSEAISFPMEKLKSTVEQSSNIYIPDLINPSVPISPERGMGADKWHNSSKSSSQTQSDFPTEKEDVNMSGDHVMDAKTIAVELSTSANNMSEDNSYIASFINESDAIHLDPEMIEKKSEPLTNLIESRPDNPEMAMSTEGVRDDLNVNRQIEEANADISAVKDEANEQLNLTESRLEEEIVVLGQEALNLGVEQRKLERNAESVSSEMFAECQELLQMFGLPYIIAPMEAEAQCAYMEVANLVDGVVTDDSDVFLFGARSVYKNIFDDRKYVETYLMKDIENELGLTREMLARMALLLGSDYTEGVSGIGIVNAMEVVNAFPEDDGLIKFREWVESPDPTILGKLGRQSGSSRKRGAKFRGSSVNHGESNVEGESTVETTSLQDRDNQQAADHISEAKLVFMEKHRNISKNWHIPFSFPSEAVISAYFSPQVDRSTEPFSWGKPDISVLRKLCWEKFGWPNQKADGLLVPVLKEYNKHETQLRLEAFYTFNERFAKIRSNRIKRAVKGSTGKQTLEVMDEAVQEDSKDRKKRKVSSGKAGKNKLEDSLEGTEEGVAGNQNKTRKRKTSLEPSSIAVQSEQSAVLESRKNTKKSPSASARGRREGRGRGLSRGRRKKTISISELSSSDSSSNSDAEEVHVNKGQEPDELRRSKRLRKPVNYSVTDIETDGVNTFALQNEIKSDGDEPAKKVGSCIQDVRGNAAGNSIDKQQEFEGFPAEKGLSNDYLEECGFHSDEGVISLADDSQDGKQAAVGAEPSIDYLQMGGGFCFGEDEEEGTVLEKCNVTTSAPSRDVSSSPQGSNFMNDPDFAAEVVERISTSRTAKRELPGALRADTSDDNGPDFAHGMYSSEAAAPEVDGKDVKDSGGNSVGFLSAMPSLRRKRRTS